MPVQRRRRRTLLLVLVFVSLLLLTMDYRQGEAGPIAAVQRTTDATFAPLQRGVAAVIEPIGGFVSGVGDLRRLREENLALQDELQELRERRVSEADLRLENARLRELLAMRERLEYTTTAGRVIAQPPGQFRWSVMIDIGADEGVAENMAVVSADGLVGKVTDVSRRHARVQLAVSPDAGYFVRIADTGQHGLLSGRGSRPLELRIIDDPETEAPPDSEVVTRAFMGTSIPDGIPIGIIDDANVRQIGGAQFLEVRPYADFNSLDFLLVILDAPVVPLDAFDADDDADAAAADPLGGG
jgi:rod shape-determining protein MreC